MKDGFSPELSPKDMLEMGVFGGWYFGNDIDEFILSSLKQQKSKVTVWGIGTRLVTAYDNPSLGLVYKLSAIKENKSWIKKIKLSEQKIKINNPGILQVHRYINDGKYDGDMIVDELIENPN